eukprot:TRINITY_DN7654_c0_g1_i1.p1 TRINITY_DN7654_c0_g1~~TRINITY_DN7654_c0_g1_i1.p1  ORF type:complete len:1048 (+),score=342.56 TRINITY_DN7654_c0_g1_i1:44-3187(+)
MNLEQVLEAALQPNTQVVQQAYEQIKILLQSPNCVLQLFGCINSQNIGVRQMAAVILRRTLGRFWPNLDKNHNDIKQLLLQRITNEPERIVRISIGELIIKVSKLTQPEKQWEDLVPFLHKMTQSQFKEHREVAYRIFSGMFETVGDVLSEQVSNFLKIFLVGMNDNEGSVRVAALKAVNSTILWLEDEDSPELFKQLIDPMLNITIQCIQNNLTSEAVDSLEIFMDLINSPIDILDPYMENILKIMLQISANKDSEFGVRSKAMLWIQGVVAVKPKTIMEKGYLPQICTILFSVASEKDSMEDSETSSKAALDTVDALSASLPEKHICSILVKMIVEYLNEKSEYKRCAALNVLSNSVKNCMNFFNDHIDECVNLLIKGLQDESAKVRTAAGVCMAFFADSIEGIETYHGKLVPILSKLLEDPNDEVKTRACYGLKYFCEELDSEEISTYINVLVQQLVGLIEKGSNEVKDHSISALQSLATCAAITFKPYFTHTMKIMGVLMQQTSEDSLIVRSRATECAGAIALAVGNELFEPYENTFVQLAASNFLINGEHANELREYSYGFFTHLAFLQEQKFTKYLSQLVPLAIKTLESEEVKEKEEKSVMEQYIEADSDEDLEKDTKISVRTAFIDEQASAVHAIGAWAQVTGADFAPYIEVCLDSLYKIVDHFHESVRQASFKTLAIFVEVLNKIKPPKQPWQTGMLSDQNPLNEVVRETLKNVVPIFIEGILSDNDEFCVIEACNSLARMVHEVGPVVVEDWLEKVLESLFAVINKDSSCQIEREEFDDDDKDLDLMNASFNAVSAIAQAYGTKSKNIFEQAVTHMLKYYDKSQPSTLRALSIGTIGEMANALETEGAGASGRLIPLALASMNDQHNTLRQNACYACGIFCRWGPTQAKPFIPQVLQSYLRVINDKVPTIADNVCGSLSRLILAFGPQIPIVDLLKAMFSLIPMKEDLEPYTPFFQAIELILNQKPELISPHLQQLTLALSIAVENENSGLEEQAKPSVNNIFKHLMQNAKQHFLQAINNLTQEQQKFLQKLSNSFSN